MANTVITPQWLTKEALKGMQNYISAVGIPSVTPIEWWDEQTVRQIYGLDKRATLPAIPPMPARKTDCSCAACQYGALLAEIPAPPPEPQTTLSAAPPDAASVKIRPSYSHA